MADSDRPSAYKAHLQAILRKSVRVDQMNSRTKVTLQSTLYRRRAAELARLADAESEELKILPLVHQALSWISLAENEEMLSEIHTTGQQYSTDA